MKIQMIVHMKNDDGTLGAESTTIEVDVPNYEAFTGPEQFGEVFDQYERKVLEARKEVTEAATEKYLGALSKKKQSQALLERKAKGVLEDRGFNTNGSIKYQEKVSESIRKEEIMLAREKVCQAIEELNRGQEKEKQLDIEGMHETFEDPSAIKAN